MSATDNRDSIEHLHQWQRARLAAYGEDFPDFRKGPTDVTALAYFFRPSETAENHFPHVKCAVLETWRLCGWLKTVFVVHEPTRPVVEFANRFPDWVEIQVEPGLRPRTPGDVASMSRDCISKLHERFATRDLLIVQDDGFPLRPGLEKFLGKWDWIGAPWTGADDWITRRLLKTSNLVGNGGFSLRSKNICQEASRLWKAGWHHLPSCYLMQEDIFFTRFLPRWSRSYRERIRIAPPEDAARFSLEKTAVPDELPFGFHSAEAFVKLESRLPR